MRAKNRSMNMTEEDIMDMIAKKKERYARQQTRMEDLKRSMNYNHNDIKQLEYTLQKLKQSRKKKRFRSFISRQHVSTFFIRISRLYDYLQHRLHCSFNYTLFCLIVNSRYCFESRTQTVGHKQLSPATVLTYFKRERAEV